MKQKLVIAKIEGRIISAVLEDEKVVELHCGGLYEQEEVPQLGDIYVGKVQNIVPNIQAAFVEIKKGLSCYYPLTEKCKPLFTNKIGKKPLCIGDELLVQLSKEAVKTKVPSVSGKLNFTGKYAVLTYGDKRLGFSSKLTNGQKERLRPIVEEYRGESYGFIVRTNAGEVAEEILRKELEHLVAEYEKVLSIGKSRTCFSCLKKAAPAYLTELRELYQSNLEEILVEDERLYEEAGDYLAEHQPEDLAKLRRYQDPTLPLHKLYSLESALELAQKERVWLKSGAYLVIQPTEALTVIDVNTGKCVNKKQTDDMWLRMNLEAAKEAAYQIRLRNLSGIILIDFINMKNPEQTQELLKKLQKELKKDSIETILVDMTKLQLVEITRKKIRRPLKEALENTQTKQEERPW